MFLQPESSPLRKSGAGSIGNWSIAISRRYNNIIRDNDRQAQIEMFLGINPDKHFLISHSPLGEEESVGPLPYISPKHLPTDFPDTDDDSDPVSQLSYPILIPSRSQEPAKDGIPHSHSNNDLAEGNTKPPVDYRVLLPQRSLSESNLAKGFNFDSLLGKEISFGRWGKVPSKPAGDDEKHFVDAPQGLREVPVDISPLELS